MLGSSTRRLPMTGDARGIPQRGRFRRGLAALALLFAVAAPPARAADVVAASQAILRERPEALAPVVAIVPARSFLFAHETQGAWVRVTTRDGRTGFVPGAVSAGELLLDERRAVGGSELPGTLRVESATELRASPAAGSRAVSTVAAGMTVAVQQRLGDWVKVAGEDGTSGWMDVVVSPVSAGAAVARPSFAERSEAPRAPVAAAPAPAATPAPVPASDASGVSATADATAQARKAEREAAAAAKKAEREAEQAAAKAQREQEDAARRAAKASGSPAPKPEKTAETPAVAATSEAEPSSGDAERAAKEAAAAERKRQEAQAKADREAADAARKQQEAAARAEKDAAERAAKEAAEAERKQQEAAARAEKDAARASSAEPKPDSKAEKEAARLAREEQERLDRERLDQARRDAEARGPAQPVDIPPPVAVTLEGKAPSERKLDPAANPLVRQGIPSPAPAGTSGTPPAGADAGRFDESAQLERSVAALHTDREEALGLSTGESRASRAESVYVGDDAKAVPTTVVSQIVVRVNDEILTNADFERSVQERLEEMKRRNGGAVPAADEREVRRRLLTLMIEQLVLLEEGKALGLAFDRVYDNAKTRFMKMAGIQDDLELVQILEATGRTWDDFRRDLLRESVPPVVLKNRVYDDITVAETDIEAHYRMHQEEWAEEGCVRIREIVLQPEPRERTRDFNQRLESLLQSLEAGTDFCELARRSSKAPSADDCGLLPTCFTRSQLDEKVALVAFRMKPGDVEPITTDWGFHVIRLEESKARRTRPLSEVRDQVLDRVRNERGAEEMRRYIDRLRETTKIDVAPEYRALLEGGPGPAAALRQGSARP